MSWSELLEKAINKKADKIPKGFQTCKQIADEQGVSIDTVQRRIRILVSKNLVEVRRFKVQNSIGVPVPVPFYRAR